MTVVSLPSSFEPRPLRSRASLLLFVPLLLAGCGYDDIRVYRVPKETGQPALSPAYHAGPGAPHVHWGELPDGWQSEAPGGMRAASFLITSNGHEVDLAVIPLSGMAGGELENVNRWRGQIGLPPTNSDGLVRDSTTVDVGDQRGRLYEMVSAEPLTERDIHLRTLAVILPRGETTWFFKMTGEDEAVRLQKEPFLRFLETVVIHEAGEHEAEPAALSSYPAAVSEPDWQIPAHWREQPAPSMVLSSFSVADESGGAVIEISRFPGDVGGPLRNVNRWRGQLGLGPIEESELLRTLETIDAAGGTAMLLDITGSDPKTGKPARMVVAMAPRPGETWFYKMTGDVPVVAREKETLVRFVKTVRYSND